MEKKPWYYLRPPFAVAGLIALSLIVLSLFVEKRPPERLVTEEVKPQPQPEITYRMGRIRWSRPQVSLAFVAEQEYNYLKTTGDQFWMEDVLSIKDNLPGHVWIANGTRVKVDPRPAFPGFRHSRRGLVAEGAEKDRQIFFDERLIRFE